MKQLFEPTSIALVGVSGNPRKLSHTLMRNVVEADKTGAIYPISRSSRTILGYETYPDLHALPVSPDLVLISVSAEHVKDAVSAAAEARAGVAVILSSGFGESGSQQGKRLETELMDIAREHGLRLMGPNCLGVYNAERNLNGTYLVKPPLYRGNVSLASQSGAFCGILVHEFNSRGIGLNKLASTGNQIDIRHQDIIEYLRDDDGTKIIGLFIEGILDGPRFLEVLRRVSGEKPVVAFKGGRTSVGRRAAASHTGSMAGDFAVAQAALKQAGAIVAHTTEEFVDCLCTLSLNHHRLPRDNRLAIVTISGGPSVVAADCCDELGLDVPVLSSQTRATLRQYLPAFAADSNPVDMTVATSPGNLSPAVDTVMSASNISGVIAINWGWDEPQFARAFVDARERHEKPVLAFASENPQVQEIFKHNGLLNFSSPERAVRSYLCLVQYSESKQKKHILKDFDCKPSLTIMNLLKTRTGILDEHESKEILAEYGIPVCREMVVREPSMLPEKAREIGYPVVLKVLSDQVAHKSNMGGVVLDIRDETELLQAALRLMDTWPEQISFLLQEQVGPGIEVLVGMKRDETFGPVLAFGLGGVLTEAINDVALRVCPLSLNDTLEMIRETKASKVLGGFRGRLQAHEEALVEIILRVGDLAARNENVFELDINPLVVTDDELKVVDALIVLDRSGEQAQINEMADGNS